MNAEYDAEYPVGENWDCPKCGRKMTLHGDCPPCDRKERDKEEAEGRIKRAKNIVVGDVICSPFGHIKVDTIPVHTVETTPKGKVIVNKGQGCRGGEETFWAEQWIQMAVKEQKV